MYLLCNGDVCFKENLLYFFFKASGSHEQIQIEDNAAGFGMEKLFSRFMTEFLTEIEIEDPYIRSHHQVMNDV